MPPLLRLIALAPQAHPHRLWAGRVAHGVVDQLGQGPLDQLQVAVQGQRAWRGAGQHHPGLLAQLELLHRVGDQFVQVEALAVQHLVVGLQRRQLEQLR